MRKLFTRLGLLALGLCIGLGAVEALSRVSYATPWYAQPVGVQKEGEWISAVKRNALNLRDRDYPQTKPENSKRVLLLGDSFTFGHGVADNDAVFPELLERELNAELGAQGKQVEVMNGGLPGSLTGDWVELLDKVKPVFQPDVIVMVFFLRDGTHTTAADSFFIPIQKEIVASNAECSLYQCSYLYRRYKDRKDRATIARNYSRALIESYLGDESQTQEWRAAQSNLKKIQAVGAELNAKVALVVFPVLADLNQGYPFQPISDLIERFGKECGMPTHNLLPDFLGKNAPELWVSAENQHPNAAGHQLAAKSLLPFVRGLLKD